MRADNAEFFHLRLQGRSFHAEPGHGAVGTAQHPVGFAQGSQDVLALGFCQGGAAVPIASGLGDGFAAEAFKSPTGICNAVPGLRITALSMTFSSSRTLPGQA